MTDQTEVPFENAKGALAWVEIARVESDGTAVGRNEVWQGVDISVPAVGRLVVL